MDLCGATWNNTLLPGVEETSKSTSLIDFLLWFINILPGLEGCVWNIAGSVLGWIMAVCKRPSNQSYLVAHTRDDTLLLALMLWSTTFPGMFNSNFFDLSVYFWMSRLYLLGEVGGERWWARDAVLPWTHPVSGGEMRQRSASALLAPSHLFSIRQVDSGAEC